MTTSHLGLALLVAAGLTSATALAQSSSWMDRVTEKWNAAGAAIPSPPGAQEPRTALATRCASRVAAGSTADTLLAAAGWTPFLHLDRTITRDDVEVVGGMAAANAFCEQTVFNLFVFAGGRFVGTLSPSPMSPGHDGAAGAIRLVGQDAITAEFSRYTTADTECCPSSVVRVTYRITRAGPGPALEAVETRRVR